MEDAKRYYVQTYFSIAKEDGRGYLTVCKPDWYTGRKKYSRVFYHHVVMCLALGLTEIPRAFVVHHIDGDTRNNELSNLALMSMSAHAKLHQFGRATTIPKGSRVQENSKCRAGVDAVPQAA